MFDRAELARVIDAAGCVVRVVIAAHQGSSPREAGAAMLVWAGGQAGTIGGGALEHLATARAHALLGGGATRVERHALGPGLGQCCGGAVTLVYEDFDAAALATVPTSGHFLRPVETGAPMPLGMTRLTRDLRAQGVGGVRFNGGWLAEPVTRAQRPVWVWGAGHVGRALVGVLAPVPDLCVTWIDTDRARFPEHIPMGVTLRHDPDPGSFVAQAPHDAEHLVLTFSHALDLDLCHRVLARGCARLGLIGSASKAVRFRTRLRALGHPDARIARIQCPIGDPALGKHPQAIAISVAHDLLTPPHSTRSNEVCA